jgi:hypothetical protein
MKNEGTIVGSRTIACSRREYLVTTLSDELGTICANELHFGKVTINDIPKPRKRAAKLLKNASVTLPSRIQAYQASVHTKKKLNSERIV